MASKQHPVPFVEGYAPGTPKTKKEKSWVDELNEIGNFLLGPHGSQLFGGLEAAAEFTPGAAVRDTMDASKTVSEGVMNLNPWETGMGLAGILMGILPGKSPVKEFPLIHGTRHEFAPTEKNPLGEFDLSKILTGEGTNYEGKGIYATEPKAEGLATSYAHYNVDGDGDISVGGQKFNDLFKALHKEYATERYNPTFINKSKALDELERMIYSNNESGVPTIVDKYIDDILNKAKEKAVTTMPIMNNKGEVIEEFKMSNFDPEFEQILNSFRGKESLIKQPGGYIYDFKVKDSPDNFINMHLPIQYQDDKIIKAVDEWFKNMPIGDKLAEEIIMWSWLTKNRSYNREDATEYLRRKFIDDEYKIPKEDMSRILQNEFMNEHMDIIKDQGVLGQKWFARHKDGGRYRDNVNKLFNDLAVIDNATSEGTAGLDMTRNQLMDKINQLELKIETMPLTDKNMDKLMSMQSTVNELNMRLMNMVGPEDIEEKLWKIYNDPNLAYNYAINDPNKTDITNRRFKPY